MKKNWPIKTSELARELHSELTLNEKNWHKYSADPDRRAAELISAALVQLLNNGNNSDIHNLMEQGMRWLKREIKPPGCEKRV